MEKDNGNVNVNAKEIKEGNDIKMKHGEIRKKNLKDSFKGKTFSPQGPGISLAEFKQYDQPELLVTNLSYQAVSDFIMDNIQEIKPVNVNWERLDIDKLKNQFPVGSEAAVDTIAKIAGANFDYNTREFCDFFDAIPILVFKKMDVVNPVSVNDNLGAVSRKEYEIDFSKIKQKNRRFFPTHGMVASVDEVNELVSVNINIISVIVSALGFNPANFGRPSERNKLFPYIKQNPQSRNFKISIASNKFLDERLFDIMTTV